MRAWSTPHSSAHRPANVPTLLGVTSNALSRSGNTSIFMRNAGIQNEWIVSGLSRWNTTDSSTGR